MNVILRKEALAKGLTRYFTGKPCQNGHISERYVINWRCIECALLCLSNYIERHRDDESYRAKEALRKAIWSKENPDKVKEHRARTRAKNMEALREKSRIRYWKNRDKELAKGKAWYAKNRDRFSIYGEKYRKNNRDKERLRHKEYRISHPEKMADKRHKYRARKIAARPILDKKVSSLFKRWETLLMAGKLKCYWCGIRLSKAYHRDHIIPLSKGGEHSSTNLVPSCAHCNCSKGNKSAYDFAAQGILF